METTNITEFIPKDKFDVVSVERLKDIDPSEITPVSIQLLEWIQDINWPVAQKLVLVLPRFCKQLVPGIKQILSDRVNDVIWKYWIVTYLLDKFPAELLKDLKTELSVLANTESTDEDEKELAEEVQALLMKYKD